MGVHINVEFFAGTDITAGSRELVALANKLGCTVMAEFNGIGLMAVPGDDPMSLANEYTLELKSNKPYKLARADSSASEKSRTVDNSTQQATVKVSIEVNQDYLDLVGDVVAKCGSYNVQVAWSHICNKIYEVQKLSDNMQSIPCSCQTSTHADILKGTNCDSCGRELL